MNYQNLKHKLPKMERQHTLLQEIKRGFLFFAFSTLLIALQFGLYITDSPILELMDFEGWLFFIASCISHAAMFALIPYLLSLIFIRFRWYKTARIVQIAGVVLLCIINYLNSQVYAIYHFHINGFVLSMVFGEGAGEIFNFDMMLYLKEIALFVVVAAMEPEAAYSVSSLDYRAITGRVSTLPISSRSLSSACRNWDTRYRPIRVPPLPTRHSAESSLAGFQAFIQKQKEKLRWSEIQESQRNSSAIHSNTRRARSLSSHSCSSICHIALSSQLKRTSISSRLGRMPTIPSSTTRWILLLSGISIATAAIRMICCWAASSRP